MTRRLATGTGSFPTRLAEASAAVAPRFDSPASTWRTFVAAIERGDRPRAGDCLTPAALGRFGPDAGSLPLEDLRAMLEDFTRIESGGGLEGRWSIYGVRPDQRPKWILFEQTVSGAWKISGI